MILIIPIIFGAIGIAVGAVGGAFAAHAAGEKDRQAAKHHRKVENELNNKYLDIQQRYNELADESKSQINHLTRKLAISEVEKDTLNLVLELQQNLISLIFSIDEEPSFKALEKLRKAILSTNFVLAKSGKQSVILPNNYILRNLDRALDSSSSYIDTAYCFYLYGQIFHDEGRYQEATSNYRKAIEIDPLNHYFYLEKGKSLIALGRYKEAISSFNTAISIEPNNPQVWGERAIAYSFLGDSDEEVKSYEHALCADPNYYQSCYENGILCEELGNKLQAVEYYTRTLKVEPTCAEAYYRRGVLNLRMGDPLCNLDYETYRQSAKDDLKKAEVLFAQQGKVMPQISYGFVSDSSTIVDVWDQLISKPKPVTLKYGNQVSIKGEHVTFLGDEG